MKLVTSFIKDFIHDTRGQSAVEFCVGAPVLIFMIFAILYVNDLYIIKEKTVVAARYATWKLSKGQSGFEDTVKSNYFPNNTDKVEVEDISGSNSFSTSELGALNAIGEGIDKVIGFISDVFAGDEGQLRYAMRVSYSMPIKLGTFDMGQAGITSMKVSSEHFVDGNTWEGDRTEIHEIFGMLWGIVKGAFNALGGADEGGTPNQSDVDNADL
jgi:hypothetical protein